MRFGGFDDSFRKPCELSPLGTMDGLGVLAQSVSEILLHCLFASGWRPGDLLHHTHATRMISPDATRGRDSVGRIRGRAANPPRIAAVTGDTGLLCSAADIVEGYSDTTGQFIMLLASVSLAGRPATL
jgi:hypothetical protein